MEIPLFKIQWDEADIEAVNSSIRRGSSWAEGPNIELFERKLIEYTGVNGALVCNSGTSALHLAMIACGINYHHEVIVPSFTFIATANCVRFVGAKPVFADIEETTLGLDPEDVERKITPRTKAIIAVHYGGIPCRIRELRQLAKKHNLILIEDAAEALGTTSDELSVGKFGDCAILSFCQNKIISTGEGGALITDNKYIYDRAKLARSHGQSKNVVASNESVQYASIGYNFRMSDMTAALGVSQMAKLEDNIAKRRRIAEHYALAPSRQGAVYQIYTIRIPNGKRDKVMQHLADNGIMSKVYFHPVHLTEFYRQGKWDTASLPVTEKVSSEVLSLPIYPGLNEEEVSFICEKVKEAL